jgi:hypothetical protein
MPRQAGNEEVESWRHALYPVQAEALEDWLHRLELANVGT